jgi:hypothetical protein
LLDGCRPRVEDVRVTADLIQHRPQASGPAKPRLNFERGRWGGRASDKAGARDNYATDPPVSEAQRKAMFAAKSGNSTIGIPQKIGAEFAKADPGGKLP